VHHNLEDGVPRWLRELDRHANRGIKKVGGYGGDIAGALAPRSEANRSDVLYSTVDTIGLPLLLLHRARILRPPLVYTSIGLVERLATLEPGRTRDFYVESLRRTRTIVAYSEYEADELRRLLGPRTSVVFVPFGVDTDYFRPRPGRGEEVDVVSIGADPRRDFELLAEAARALPDRSFRIVTTAERAGRLGALPANVSVESDVPFGEVRERLAVARLVALPVRGNSYSGATTVLLQALAMGKPVVVSRTDAIARGYGLDDGGNCRLVAPGDAGALVDALRALLGDERSREALGARGREVAETLSWDRYASAIHDVLAEAGART